MLQKDDRHMLARALDLAARGGAAVAPNPRVGAVITRDDEIVAEGYHAAYGGPHAEAVALERAGSRARGTTLYCNLEPCSYSAPDKHNGACTDLIIAAGVARVVVGQLDPNPRVRGGGVAALRAAGVEVDTPDDFDDVWYENAAFNTTAALARPFVTLKLAQSLDGKIATATGDSKWITDEEARAEVHALRARHDAVLVGVGTAVADDPRLTVRGRPEPTATRRPRGRRARPLGSPPNGITACKRPGRRAHRAGRRGPTRSRRRGRARRRRAGCRTPRARHNGPRGRVRHRRTPPARRSSTGPVGGWGALGARRGRRARRNHVSRSSPL